MSRQPIVRYLPAGVQCLTVTATDLRSGDQIVSDKETVLVVSVDPYEGGRNVRFTGRIVRGTGKRKAPYSWFPVWDQAYDIERGHA